MGAVQVQVYRKRKSRGKMEMAKEGEISYSWRYKLKEAGTDILFSKAKSYISGTVSAGNC